MTLKGILFDFNGTLLFDSDLHMDALGNLVKSGMCLDAEEFIRRCVLEKIVPKNVEEEAFENAFRLAQQSAALK